MCTRVEVGVLVVALGLGMVLRVARVDLATDARSFMAFFIILKAVEEVL